MRLKKAPGYLLFGSRSLIISAFPTPLRIANKLALRLSRKGRVISPNALRVLCKV